MKTENVKFCFTALLVLAIYISGAQNILVEYDSVPVTKPKIIKDSYFIGHGLLKEITIEKKKPGAATKIPKNIPGNFSGGVFTLLTGISTESSVENIWVIKGELKANPEIYTWQVHLFFHGELVKSRERIRNEDGSSSLETQKGIFINRDKGAFGFILENTDTIGSFNLKTNVESELEDLKWITRLELQSKTVRAKTSKFIPAQMYSDIKIYGFIDNTNFSSYTRGNSFMTVNLIENQPVCVFQSDPDLVILGKKNKINPYLLFDKSLNETEQLNQIRLSILTKFIAKTIDVDFYEM